MKIELRISSLPFMLKMESLQVWVQQIQSLGEEFQTLFVQKDFNQDDFREEIFNPLSLFVAGLCV